jgi:predicted phage terminase large subunit-like protein
LEHGGSIFGTFDCASKTGFSNAYSVGLVVGFLDRTVFVLDMYRDRVELPGLLDMYDQMQSEWAGLIGEYLVEDASNGTALLQMRAATAIHPQHHGGKETRAGYTETHQRQGNIMLSEMGGWHEWLKKEHALFPNGTFADTVDALAQAILHYTIHVQQKPKPANKNDEFGWLEDMMNSDPQLRALMF